VKTRPSPVLSLAAWSARILPKQAKSAIYRSAALAPLLRSILNRSAPHGLVPVTIAAGELEGAHMVLDLQMEKDYWLGTYEPRLQAAITDLADEGMVAYDVGANIGYTTLLLAEAVGVSGEVIAFEPLPANLERLRQNLALNGLESRVRVIAGAVVESENPLRFFTGPSGASGKAEGSTGRDLAEGGWLEVDGISLDSFVFKDGNRPPDIVKMDIEGGEVLALPGMRRLLHERGPVLLLELHGPESAQAAWAALPEAGYQLSLMEPGYPAVQSASDLDWKAYVIARRPSDG
jgi:FkbM family methyltransferase